MNNSSYTTVMYGCLPPTDVWPPGFSPEIPPNWYPPQPLNIIPDPGNQPLLPTFVFHYPLPRTTEDRVSELEQRIFMLEKRLFFLENERRNAHSIDE
jgi:hypothetical protein